MFAFRVANKHKNFAVKIKVRRFELLKIIERYLDAGAGFERNNDLRLFIIRAARRATRHNNLAIKI